MNPDLAARLAEAREKAQRGRQAEARGDLLELVKLAPNSALVPESLYEAAWLEKGDVRRRVEEFRQLAFTYPETVWAARSLLEIGESCYELLDYVGALDAYEAYVIVRGDGYDKPALRLKMIYCLLKLRRYDEALSALDQLDASAAAFRTTEQSLDLRAECLMAVGRFDEAAQTLTVLMRDYPNYGLMPKALLSLGLCQEEMGRTAAAREAYGQILDKFASAPFEARVARARLEMLDRSLFPHVAPPTVVPAPGPALPPQAGSVSPPATRRAGARRDSGRAPLPEAPRLGSGPDPERLQPAPPVNSPTLAGTVVREELPE